MSKMRLFFAVCAVALSLPVGADDVDGFRISWESPSVLGRGTCARVLRLNDGRYMAVYRDGGCVCRFSGDVCRSWGSPRRVLPDFEEAGRGRVTAGMPAAVQLPPDHPARPGRILCVAALYSGCPGATLAVVSSDDGGATWDGLKNPIPGARFSTSVERGGSNGFALLCLPDGTVWIYVACGAGDASSGGNGTVSILESCDGGETWSAPRALGLETGTEGGISAALTKTGSVVLAFSARPEGERPRLQFFQASIPQTGGAPLSADSWVRYDPIEVSSGSRPYGVLAPFLAETEAYYLMCGQTAGEPSGKPQEVAVAAMRKTDVASGRLSSFRGMSRPLAGRFVSRSSSLCPLGGDTFLLVSSDGNEMRAVRGRIQGGDPRPAAGGAVMAWRKSAPDPTTWREGGVWYAASTAQQVLTSDDFFTWRETGRKLLEESEYAYWRQRGYRAFWAPDVTEINGRPALYLTCYRSCEDCLIAAYTASRPGGPFAGRHVITRSQETGIRDTIDPEAVYDTETGKRWLFFGSVDGIHRVELAEDGLSLKPGSPYVHVAGLTDRQDPSRRKVFEGAYLHRRKGWWYLFASRGWYGDSSYAIVVGRSRALEGVFADRRGAPMADGNATPVLESGNDPRFYGPGHNGEIQTVDGRDYLIYHGHVRDFPGAPRTLFIRELFWDADGWPRTGQDRNQARR